MTETNTVPPNEPPVAEEGLMMRVVQQILSHGVDGLGPFASSNQLAAEYEHDERYSTVEARVDAMIRWEASKSFGTGFVTGLGGLVTLPVTIPTALYASWVVQARLAGAIAELYGHSTREDRVRTLVLGALLGDSVKETLKQVGVAVGNKMAARAVQRIPGRVLIEINKKIGFRLLTKAGERGLINLMKLVPIAGGLVGGGVDAAACVTVGRTAQWLFRPASDQINASPDE